MSPQNTKTAQKTRATNNLGKKPIVTGKTALIFSLIAPFIWFTGFFWAALLLGFIIGLLALKFDPLGRKYAKWAIIISLGIFAVEIIFVILLNIALEGH